MTYIAKTFSYIKKSFWMLLLIASVPAVLLGLFVRPLGFITFIPDFAVSEINSYADIAWLIFDRHATMYVYPMILIFATLTVCMALALSVIEKHFRTGRLMLKAPLRDLNSSLFPMLKTLALMFAAYMLFKFIVSGLVTLLHFLLSGAGVPNTLTVIIVSVVIAVAFFIIIYFSAPVMFWAPLMLTFGYSFVDALIEAARMTGKAAWRLFAALAFPFVTVALLQCVFELLPLHIVAMKAIAAVLYLFLIIYICALMPVATFDLSELERRDIKKPYPAKGNDGGI